MKGVIKAPQLVKILCYQYEAWIMGGAARVIALNRGEPIKDWDILVPAIWWPRACMLITKGTPANSFGGFKVVEDGVDIDVWAGDVGWLLSHCPIGLERVAYSPIFQTMLTAEAKSKRF